MPGFGSFVRRYTHVRVREQRICEFSQGFVNSLRKHESPEPFISHYAFTGYVTVRLNRNSGRRSHDGHIQFERNRNEDKKKRNFRENRTRRSTRIHWNKICRKAAEKLRDAALWLSLIGRFDRGTNGRRRLARLSSRTGRKTRTASCGIYRKLRFILDESAIFHVHEDRPVDASRCEFRVETKIRGSLGPTK